MYAQFRTQTHIRPSRSESGSNIMMSFVVVRVFINGGTDLISLLEEMDLQDV